MNPKARVNNVYTTNLKTEKIIFARNGLKSTIKYHKMEPEVRLKSENTPVKFSGRKVRPASRLMERTLEHEWFDCAKLTVLYLITARLIKKAAIAFLFLTLINPYKCASKANSIPRKFPSE